MRNVNLAKQSIILGGFFGKRRITDYKVGEQIQIKLERITQENYKYGESVNGSLITSQILSKAKLLTVILEFGTPDYDAIMDLQRNIDAGNHEAFVITYKQRVGEVVRNFVSGNAVLLQSPAYELGEGSPEEPQEFIFLLENAVQG